MMPTRRFTITTSAHPGLTSLCVSFDHKSRLAANLRLPEGKVQFGERLCFGRGRHILMCVAKALIYLHKHDIVHLVGASVHLINTSAFLLPFLATSSQVRSLTSALLHAKDVKSANVLLKRGDAKLADVGLSLMLSKSFANSCSGMGTFSWAATELLLGSHPVSPSQPVSLAHKHYGPLCELMSI